MSQERQCCAVVEESAARARDRRYADPKPTPWIVLKMMVFVTLGFLGYGAYVYIGLMVMPMLHEQRGAQGSRKTGVALLVPFAVLLAWTLWAYYKIVATPPGYVRDHFEKTQKPPYPQQTHLLYPPLRGDEDAVDLAIGRPSYEDLLRTTAANGQNAVANSNPSDMERTASTMTIKSGTSTARLRFEAGEMLNPAVHEIRIGAEERPPVIAEPTPAVLAPSVSLNPSDPTNTPHQRRRATGKLLKRDKSMQVSWVPCFSSPVDADRLERGAYGKSDGEISRTRKAPKSRTYVARRPPMTPHLHPAHRYCDREGFVKPYRAHHCRNCDTCILKFDHHCPWIGQCVGARNHKFFVNFCQAAFLLTAYMFATLLPYTVKGFQANVHVDPQQLVIIALSALFALFTFSLAVSHIYMIVEGQTTVESLQIRTMKHREAQQLAKAFSCWQIRAKSDTLKQWDEEWGKLDTEGNIWWIGGKKREWVAVMGSNPLGWIFPIGQGEGDGLTYPVNPRFDEDGRWRRREEWPPELR